MALKLKVSKEDHGQLEEGTRRLYIEDGDGYRLDVDGGDDNGALKRAKDREVELRKAAELRAREMQDKLEALNDDSARKSGNVEVLEKSWQSKYDKMASEYQAQIDGFKKTTDRNLRDGTAKAIAAKISNAPELLHPHILSRLTVEYDGAEAKLRVLDQNGQVSAMSVDDLSNEFVANKNFSAIMTASKASGGGGANAGKSGPSFQGSATKRGDVASMTMAEKIDYYRAKGNGK